MSKLCLTFLLQEAGFEQDPHEDLTSETERALGRLVKEQRGTDFYMLYGYPVAARPFYTMLDPDDREIALAIPKEKEQLLDVMKPADFNQNEVIMTEGEAGDAFYIVEEGEVVCTKIINGKKTDVSDKLGPGSFFGELALINNAARAATVTATTDTSCVKIMRDDFKRVMGSLKEMLKSNNELYAKYALGVQM